MRHWRKARLQGRIESVASSGDYDITKGGSIRSDHKKLNEALKRLEGRGLQRPWNGRPKNTIGMDGDGI